MTEMTNEELLNEFGPDVLTGYGRELRAELLRRLGAGVPASPQVDLEKVARQIARVMRIQIHDLWGKGQEINSPDNASNNAWLDDRSSDDAKLILPLLPLPASLGVPQPLPSVEEIIKTLGNGWKEVQLSDEKDLMFAIGQIRLAIMKCKPLAASEEVARPLVIGEPCPTCERRYLGKMGLGEYSCATCGMGMIEPCEHWKKIENDLAATPSTGEVDVEPLPARISPTEFLEQWADRHMGEGNRPCGWPNFGSISYAEVAKMLKEYAKPSASEKETEPK